MTGSNITPEVLAALRRYDTPTIANAIETFDVRPRDEGFASLSIRCMFPELGRMVGFAATATIRARGGGRDDPAPLWSHVRSVSDPRVVVVQDLDIPPAHGSLWGEVNATIFTALGCIGCVTDGCVRDLTEARNLGFHFFARGAGVSHAYVRVESVGDTVVIAGLRIAPGDLIHADQHGVLLIPKEIASELPLAADRLVAAEQRLLGWVRSPEFDPDKLGEMRSAQH
jgi:4-hydroxy-4-methyl-2-oxoglutarate aldolase